MSERPSPPEALRPEGPRFPLGRIGATRGALGALQEAGEDGLVYLARHVRGDWGEVSAEDAQANEDALLQGERLLSAYTLSTQERLWIITEADRASTTMLLPAEY